MYWDSQREVKGGKVGGMQGKREEGRCKEGEEEKEKQGQKESLKSYDSLTVFTK